MDNARVNLKYLYTYSLKIMNNISYSYHFLERIVEDFELIPMPEETKFHIEIKECPLKYEFLRRPSLVFPEEKCYFHTNSTLKKTHESCIQVHMIHMIFIVQKFFNLTCIL